MKVAGNSKLGPKYMKIEKEWRNCKWLRRTKKIYWKCPQCICVWGWGGGCLSQLLWSSPLPAFHLAAFSAHVLGCRIMGFLLVGNIYLGCSSSSCQSWNFWSYSGHSESWLWITQERCPLSRSYMSKSAPRLTPAVPVSLSSDPDVGPRFQNSL